jgi:hypothetical protein
VGLCRQPSAEALLCASPQRLNQSANIPLTKRERLQTLRIALRNRHVIGHQQIRIAHLTIHLDRLHKIHIAFIFLPFRSIESRRRFVPDLASCSQYRIGPILQAWNKTRYVVFLL